MALRIKTIAHRNAEPAFMAAGRKRLDKLFPNVFEYFDDAIPGGGGIPGGDGSPDVICFLSGGSEQEAISVLSPDKLTLLLAGFEDNAFAAAMEVVAWAGNRGVPVMLVSLQEAEEIQLPEKLALVCKALKNLRGKRAGLIGGVSHWLVASAVHKEVARKVLGRFCRIIRRSPRTPNCWRFSGSTGRKS
jgi:hypothetical protein